MDCSMSGFPVLHHLLELAQTHVHWVGDAIQPSHPLLPLSPPASYLSQHQLVGSSHQVAKVLELQLQHQSFQWIFRIDFLLNWLVWSPCSPRDSQESSSTPQFKSINSLVLILVYGPTLTSIHEYIYTHIYIFCSNVLLESPSQVVEPLQICLRIVYLLSQHSSDMYVCVCVCVYIYIYIFFFFFWLQQEGLGQIFWLPSFHSPYQGLSAYYWVHGWAGFLSGPGAHDVRSHNTHKDAFVHEWMSILLSEREDKKRNTLHQCDAGITDNAVSFWS